MADDQLDLTADDRQIYDDLARNIAAAAIADRLGLKGVGRARTQYCNGSISDAWLVLAKVAAEVATPQMPDLRGPS